jgi:hypothetical protein
MHYTVFSLDMWGHVPADCAAEHGCPCMVDGAHDDNRCNCSEDCNAQYRCGSIKPDADLIDDDDVILDALLAEGLLSDKGRAVCTVQDWSDGPLEIEDDAGRRIFHLEPEGE